MNTISSIKGRRLNIILASVAIPLIVFLDQTIKVYVKTDFLLHEQRKVFSWMYLYFIENGGMAFGADFMGTTILSVARILFIGLLVWYLVKLVRYRVPHGYVLCIAMVIAGAVGNIIDNAFYGLIFSESGDFDVASFVPFGSGYAGFMAGKVVDMFYMPIIDTYLPASWPIAGGMHFVFFAPVFNLADASITTGALACLIFYRNYMVSFNRLRPYSDGRNQGEDEKD